MEKCLGNSCGLPPDSYRDYWADRDLRIGLPNKLGDHKLVLLLLLLLFGKTHPVLAQPPAVFTQIIKNFTTDNLGNIYTLTVDNQVVKYSPDGVEQFRYPNRTLGEASLLDATNPFHLLLFFPDYQTVLTLDRTLSVTGQFNLFQLGFQGARAVGTSSDGLLWVYDETSFFLKKITADGTVIAQSGDLSLATGQPLHPVFLVEREQTVFMTDPDVGVLVFDIFGRYRKTIPLPGLREFQVMDDQLVYFREGQLWSFHLTALLERPFTLPFELEQVAKVQVANGILYVLESGKLAGHRI
ncbi:MAG: hypothetical protein K9J37_09300 [Saprospiraceae bacterium]|nr:hypothetical protein [Saprospiraceae bacterium]MCF8250099.1 hypothetical protein [Saprospiraceae bacterium]MCF8279561.1 hypothetical protein [Bacteroidales bacterium]MCF8311935.1 hypothetical protein [Saprospiraceae bacterium]MCF8440375.1 hypothetical protein [Saprospiraceae bacterium]